MDDVQRLVLVVDDDESVRRSLRWLLITAGYQVATFDSGTDFLEHGTTGKAACLLLDVRMPDMTGLEVKNASGDWVAAPPLPGTFVVNIGDLLEIWSNGSFASTWHRVRPVSEERYSFPLFFTVDYDTVVEPFSHLCPDGARYEALVSGEHLLAQTMQSFRYLEERQRLGLLSLPERAHGPASFGHKP